MVFSVSPSVSVTEVDLTSNIPALASTQGAIAGVFNWGPTNAVVQITSEADLVATFGKPDASSYETFFVAADFLSYSNQLLVVRAAENTSTATASIAGSGGDVYQFDAKYPGSLGNSLGISFIGGTNKFSTVLFAAGVVTDSSNTNIFNSSVFNFAATVDKTSVVTVGDILTVGNGNVGFQNLVVSGVNIVQVGNTASYAYTLNFENNYILAETSVTAISMTRKWAYAANVGKAPTTGHGHFIITDADGKITGIPGTVLEQYINVSLTPSKLDDGTDNYYVTLINGGSSWITVPGNSAVVTNGNIGYLDLISGSDGKSETAISFGKLALAYDQFKNTDEYDISLILQGKASSGTDLANYIIGNICETRKDCMIFISPSIENIISGGTPLFDKNAITANIVNYRNLLQSSSYWFMDSGYKYRYDKYNDAYRWVPMNGDMAGLASRIDPWVSPAGYKRGIIKNVVKLAFNPNQSQRDTLFSNDINPVISQAGQGTLLFGDKTGLGRASAFNRINVRRLFITIEKLISTASASILFDFNDDFTQTEFKNLIDPLLRDIKGKRGIIDYYIVCDSRVNTPDVIDSNTFRANIFIKPARSLSFIELNFIAVRTGVSFEEVIGQQF